jgi:hypothetical protein
LAANPHHSYTAPQWLLAQSKKLPKYFSIATPSVTANTLKKVQSSYMCQTTTPNKIRRGGDNKNRSSSNHVLSRTKQKQATRMQQQL